MGESLDAIVSFYPVGSSTQLPHCAAPPPCSGAAMENAMQKNTRTLCLVGFGLAVVATAALAASPKFLRAPSATLESPTGKFAASAAGADAPALVIRWTEVGLGDTDTVEYAASAKATARYQCVNRGGNCPSASNKQNVFADVSVTGTFPVDRNGRISDSLTILAPPSTLVCPGNQVVSWVSVTFSDITLTDLTHDITVATKPSEVSDSAPECP
jgi:hypothetical protein